MTDRGKPQYLTARNIWWRVLSGGSLLRVRFTFQKHVCLIFADNRLDGVTVFGRISVPTPKNQFSIIALDTQSLDAVAQGARFYLQDFSCSPGSFDTATGMVQNSGDMRALGVVQTNQWL